jgi:hypothetical protein
MSDDYKALVKRGCEIRLQRERQTPEYKQVASLVDLSKGQAVSSQTVACEACGLSDEARNMVWVQDSEDAPLYDRDWRLALWKIGRRAQFSVFYYCQFCYGKMAGD